MKKTFLMLAAFILCLQIAAFSQKTRAGITAGVVLASMTGESGGNDNDFEKKVGYTIGFVVDAPIKNTRFSFAPGLHFVQKGTQQEPPLGTLITKSYIATRYAELNANFIVKSGGTKGQFFIGAGPSFCMPLPSKKGTMIEKDKTETDVLFGKTIEKDLVGFDYGVNMLTGYRLSCGFFATINFNMGMRDLRPVEESGPSDIKNRYIGIQFGWLFNNKEKEK